MVIVIDMITGEIERSEPRSDEVQPADHARPSEPPVEELLQIVPLETPGSRPAAPPLPTEISRREPAEQSPPPAH